jgi:hypothetical protein
MLWRLRTRELRGSVSEKKSRRKNVQYWKSDVRLRKVDDGKRRRKSKQSKTGNERSGRPGRRPRESVKKGSKEIGNSEIGSNEIGSAIESGKEIPEKAIVRGTETGTETGTGIETEIGSGTKRIDTEDTTMIPDPADTLCETIKIMESPAETRYRSQNCLRRKLNVSSRRL